MFTVDMNTIKPVGEFGSAEWCRACADYGMKILEASDLPGDLSWGFSETYTHAPTRFLSDDRPLSGYYFMVKNGVISGGDGVPDSCLAIPGFHARLRWAYICNQSSTKYGREGQKQRSIEEGELVSEMATYLGAIPDMGGVPNPVWPQPIIAALSAGVEEGGGLHNIAATLQGPSPEFTDLPTTALGVPLFREMNAAQKVKFIGLCGLLAQDSKNG